ncbi:MAG: DEAD/DEAH box helicase family protein [Ruminococcus sp.]
MITKATSVNSKAEELFVELFCETFGPDKANNLYIQHPFVDIYGNHRYIDFALENQDMKIAIEIDGETYHNPKKVSDSKYFDDLLKQNSMVFNDWRVYRWAYNQLLKQPEKVKDELITFLGETPFFKEFQDFLPQQEGQAFELREYQQEAIDNLKEMREKGETIALLYHATGVGKTVTATTDAKEVGGRTLFLVNALKLADQAEETFKKIWPEATRSKYTGEVKNSNGQVVFATVQTMSKHLINFNTDSFDYIIVDECHHAAAKTYQKIFSYFNPKFILGLSATPERSDGEDMLALFQNVAHKMDLETAVKRGILAPIRCIRIKTDIDLSDVRINGIKYNSQDLESKLFIPERNKLIADTYVNYVKDKKTVIFCASVNHSMEIAKLLREMGVNAESVSGRDKKQVRDEILNDYENGDTNVLCACDLLNEGWDSPRTEVLFMARPTMSKTIYMQQLGRGTRKCAGKTDLLVFDFVDNANMFNMPYSIHRLLNIEEYHTLEYVLAPDGKKNIDNDMLRKGEKPEAYLDIPISIDDFETINLFNWQNEVKDMMSQREFIRMVDVQSETVDRYVREGKIVPDMAVPIGEKRFFNYYREDTVRMYADKYGWDLITSANIKDKFMKFIEKMDMSFSYKTVLLKAIFDHIDESGKVRIVDIVNYFIDFYEGRKERGLVAEKANSIYQKGGYTEKDVERNIFSNPFKRFADMRFLKRCKDVNYIEINPIVFKKLTADDVKHILAVCDEKLDGYYGRLENR